MGTPYAEVIGDPVEHSKSPLIHRFWLEKLGIEGDYRATRVAPDALGDFLRARASDPDWRGCNITIPHKEAALSWAASLSPAAAEAGAVNTLVPVSGGLAGFNFDVDALAADVLPKAQEAASMEQAVIVIGAGGAARAVLQILRNVPTLDIAILNRNRARAETLLHDFALAGAALPLDARLPPAGLVVNASSLGMTGYPPLEIDLSPAGRPTVYDLVYAPIETDLLRQARQRGLATFDGLTMLIGQARLAFERFFRLPPPQGTEPELRELLTR